MGVTEKWTGHVEQCVLFKDTIGIDDTEEGITGEGNGRIDRIGPTTIDLLDDDKIGILLRLMDPENLAAMYHAFSKPIDAPEMKTLGEYLHGAISGSVAHDDDLKLRVVQTEDVPNGGAYDGSLVVTGNDETHRHGEVRFGNGPEL
jgi:hypothetical protein